MSTKLVLLLLGLVLFSGCASDVYVLDISEPINISYPAVGEIQITGKGQGVYKTTTGVYQNTIYEAFGNLDTIYSTWIVPSTIDYDNTAEIVFKFFIPISITDKTMQLYFEYTVFDGNKFVNVSSFNYTSPTFNVSSTAYEYFEYRLPIDLAVLNNNCDDNCVISGIVQRVDSGINDYSGEVNLFSMFADYYDFRPALESASQLNNALWYQNGTEIYTNATAVNIGGYRMYDDGTDFVFEVVN